MEVIMKSKKTNRPGLDVLWLAIGAVAYAFIGWRWSAPAATWIAPVFLVRFFRNQEKWYVPLLSLPFLYAAFLTNMIGAWDLPIIAQVILPAVVPLPLIVVLYIDRALSPRLTGIWTTLVFPAAYVTMDYILGFTPLGTLFSTASTQFSFAALAQTASLTGIWGISFLIAWFAAVVNTAWENGFDLGLPREAGTIHRFHKPVAVFTGIAFLLVAYGSVRIATSPSRTKTVRVAGITVEHPRDYWALLDIGAPKDEVAKHRDEIHRIEEALFTESTRAAQAGAEIIFWAEGNGVIIGEELEGFVSRAGSFAKRHGVYFAPAILELRYGSSLNYNEVLMFTPEGELAFTYQKTKSWLPVESDGVIKAIETPYGTLAATICFDMDFPGFLRQAAKAGTDIMLVPGYDSERIRPFHTEPALLRGIEGGYSVVRQVNEGTSMAADHRGTVLARQDYFMTENRLMFADVPIEGTRTLYGYFGDWFAWASIALLAVLLGLIFKHRAQAE
jgi:apolipoprotein N-acyltransferase